MFLDLVEVETVAETVVEVYGFVIGVEIRVEIGVEIRVEIRAEIGVEVVEEEVAIGCEIARQKWGLDPNSEMQMCSVHLCLQEPFASLPVKVI